MRKSSWLTALLSGLLVVLCATAFAGDPRSTVDNSDAKRIIHSVSTNPLKTSVLPDPDASFRAAAITQTGTDLPYPSTYVAGEDCEILDYSDYSDNGVNYFFDMYRDDRDEHATRFNAPEGHISNLLKGAAVRIYEISDVGGGIDLILNVREDTGVQPGAILYSDTIPAATLQARGPGFLMFTFPTPVEIDAPSYYIGFKSGYAGSRDDYLMMGLNTTFLGGKEYTSNGRSMDLWYGDMTWYPSNFYWNFPINIRIAADVCYGPYSVCRYIQPSFQYFWPSFPAPNFDLSGRLLDGWGQRFTAGRDTLKTVVIPLYIDPSPKYAGTNETNGLTVQVWGDDGGGRVDYTSGPIATRVIPGGLDNIFPTTHEDLSSGAIVEYLEVDFSSDLIFFDEGGQFHVTVQMTSENPDDGAVIPIIHDFGDEAGSVNYNYSSVWTLVADDPIFRSAWQNAFDWCLGVELCGDEFSTCNYQFLYDQISGGTNAGIPMDDNTRWNCGGAAQLCKASVDGSGARIERIRFQLLDEVPYGGEPGDNGNPLVKAVIWTAGSGDYGDPVPNEIIWESDPFTPAYFPEWNDLTIIDVNTTGDFYVGYLPVINNPGTDYFYAALSVGDPEEINGGAVIWYWPWYDVYGSPNQWVQGDLFYGENADLAMEVRYCYNPIPPRNCQGDDWVTLQHDFQRSGASGTELGNARCFLEHDWDYTDTFGNAQWVGPIIYNGSLITTFKSSSGTEYTVRDLATKEVEYTFDFDGEVKGMPTAYHVEALATDVLFVTGGTDDAVVRAIDLATGLPIWTISSKSDAVNLMPSGMSLGEINQFSNFMILNDGSDDILYFSTTYGRVFAVYAATGQQYWDAPYQHPGYAYTLRSGATDGIDKLFYAIQTSTSGDMVCLDAFTGAVNWKLSDDGFKNYEVFGGGVTSQTFQSGIAVDVLDGAPKVYVVSTVTGAPPREAILYQVDAETGVTTAYTATNGVGYYNTPVIGRNRVFLPSQTTLDQPVHGVDLQAYSKRDLTIAWGVKFGRFVGDDVFDADLLLTCESFGGGDLLFGMDHYGYLRCINVDEGVELFHRRVDYGTGEQQGGNGAIGRDNLDRRHLVWQSIYGVYDMVMGSEARARLQLMSYENRAIVPFGNDPDYQVTFPDVFMNNGCTDLTADIAISDVSNGAGRPPLLAVPEQLDAKARSIADLLSDAENLKQLVTHNVIKPLSAEVYRESDRKNLVNPAALADMSWINTPLVNTTTPARERGDITVTINQGLVGRGVHRFYASFTNMNDDDYWLNVSMNHPAPEVQLDFVGGCLVEMTELRFGDGGANIQYVFNTARLATHAENDITYGFDIDGGNVNADHLPLLYAGHYILGTSDRRIAFNCRPWVRGATEAEAWASWLPDIYDGECAPKLQEDVQLGSWSDDGVTYHPIYGNVVDNNSIDSVQNFAQPDGSWWWDDSEAPYDNDSTMGLAIHHRHLGVYDHGQGVTDILDYMNNVTVEIMEVTERNGRALPGWYIGSYLDFDFRSSTAYVDTTLWDPEYSIAWGFCLQDYSPRPLAGMISLPMNFCGNPSDPFYREGMLNAMALNQRQGMWMDGHDVPFLDSAYRYMTRPSGLYSHDSLPPANDQASSFTFTHHDFAPNETFSFATAYFEFEDYNMPTETYGRMAPMALILNKWMGFGRGDVNNDNKIDLSDVVYLANYVNYNGPGPIPFLYLGNVNAASSGAGIDMADVMFLVNYYFNEGACPEGVLKNTGRVTDAADY